MIKALIFDFDGLIIETESCHFQAWQEVFRSYGFEIDFAKWSVNIGSNEEPYYPPAQLEALVGKPIDQKAIAAAHAERVLALAQTRPVLPGIRACIHNAKTMGLKLGVASSSDRTWVHGHLQRLGLFDAFDCIRTGDQVRITKPDPEVYVTAMECLGIGKLEGVAFEDSANGILAAKRAGLYCVAIPNPLTVTLDLSLADLRLDSLADLPLPTLLAQLEQIHETNPHYYDLRR
jgi:HAD superfamily hydrolase (TIGR01509 family)